MRPVRNVFPWKVPKPRLSQCSRPSGGFGLTGLAERVGALGGRLRAGPRPEGGWEVVALLPGGER